VSGGAYPLATRPASVLMRGISPTMISTTHSLKRVARGSGAQRWYLRLKYGPLKNSEWNPIVGFCDEQLGRYGKFTIVVPGKEAPLGAVSGAPLVNGAQAAGVTSVNLKSLANGVNGVFKAGDLVVFATHLKVYQVTRAANSDGGGLATIYINCPLLTAVADGNAVTWQNVSMQCALLADTFDREWKSGLVCPGFEVDMIEDPY